MPSYPGSAPALSKTYADGTTSATNHPAAHNTVNDEVNAIGTDLVAAAQGAGSLDALLKGRDVKASVRVASTANVTISPGGTSLAIDGITLANADRVFLKDQTTPAENGLYVVGGVGTSVTLTRSADANASAYMSDATLIMVEQGAANADTAWELVSDNPITLGTTPLYWTRAWPDYLEDGARNPWAATGTVCQNMRRDRLVSGTAMPTAANWVYAGGGVLPAGKTVTNINVYVSAVGTAHTVKHFSIVRLSDRAVLQRTANSTTLPTINTWLTTPLQAAYTAPVDTPIYVVLGIASSTAMSLGGTSSTVNSAVFSTPILGGTTATSPPTTTPPTVGTILPVPAAVQYVNGWYLT